ncbi:uncharacterized protein LOC117331580 [Pecten maximus]|uniref:uncharacterized protein LOC117331580 n=1 Tax=Pecten maximus TaxID=6579 RepID=UPI00145821EB|nr:uncharacterized protein LOC117331580 [Pecten maximus]
MARLWKKKLFFIFTGAFLLYITVKWMLPIKTRVAETSLYRYVWMSEPPSVGEVNQERTERIHKVCTAKEKELRGNKSRTDISRHMHIDPKHKLTYCFLLKAGYTFWGLLFRIVRGDFNTTSPFDPAIFYRRGTPIASLGSLSHMQQALFFNNSFSFMLTRDPYSRLFSGYTDKLFMPNQHWYSVAPKITQVARHRHQKCASDIQFKEFIKYIIYSEEHRQPRDLHYHFAFDFCDPCQYKYDFIGKLETIKQDTMYLLDKMNQTKVIENLEKDLRGQYINFTIKERIDHLFSSQKKILTCKENFFQVQRKFWKGFQVYGIISKRSKYPVSEEKSHDITPEIFHDTVVKAIGDAADAEVSRRNKEEALLEAYSTVETEDMEKLSRLLKPDCEVFGYDCRPSRLFKDRKYIKPWYFDITTA